MKCPNGHGVLAPTRRDSVEMEACPTCNGMWLSAQALDALENKAFDLGDDEKGSLVFEAEPSARPCPACGEAMQSFEFRAYDLQLEFCPAGHGFWLDADEDKRVLELMKEEEARLKRSWRAQDHWSSHLHHLRSHDFLQKVRNLFG
jgi:Zn-finger nucleic acid-binding protein